MAGRSYETDVSIPMGNGVEAPIYRAKDVKYTVGLQDGSQHILRNFQDGDMGTITKDEAKITGINDPQGSPGAVENASSLGKGVNTLMWGSPSCKLLIQLYNSGEYFSYHKQDGEEYVGGDHCFISEAPEIGNGKDFQTRQFTIVILDYDLQNVDDM